MSKFEGHTPGPWIVDNIEGNIGVSSDSGTWVCSTGVIKRSAAIPNAALIAAAPDLLADSERLQAERDELVEFVRKCCEDWAYIPQDAESEAERLYSKCKEFKNGQ